jgi:hypothetical protein
MGSSAARSTRPTSRARDTDPWTTASRSAGVSKWSAMSADEPEATHRARPQRSAHTASTGRSEAVLPSASTRTTTSGFRPATCMDTICSSGKARPIPSASSRGSPSRAAQPTGATPFAPPISAAITATTRRPVSRSTSARAASASRPLPGISRATVGAPIIDSGRISPSVGRSVIDTRGTSPYVFRATEAANSSPETSPPPPVP